jgi:hypothetical protein
MTRFRSQACFLRVYYGRVPEAIWLNQQPGESTRRCWLKHDHECGSHNGRKFTYGRFGTSVA